MIISNLYVQEKKLIIAGHAGQLVKKGNGKKKMQTTF